MLLNFAGYFRLYFNVLKNDSLKGLSLLTRGREAFLKMKGIEINCKVIIASGFTKGENIDELKDLGLAGFIQKPFRDYELSKLLSDILN